MDLYFPPARDEAPGGSTAPTMLLSSSACRAAAKVYATAFTGADWNLTALTTALNPQAAPTPPTTEAQLRADLMSESPEYDTIDLPANHDDRDHPAARDHPFGQDRRQQRHARCSSKAIRRPGRPTRRARSTSMNRVYTNIQIELDDFTIKFDIELADPMEQPGGDRPALWDPENNPGGIVHAVIDTAAIPIPT